MIANYSHKWWYYAISVLLIIATLLLLIYSPFHRANALVATGVVIAAVLAALAAFGITTVVTGMTSAQVSDYIDGKLSEWATFKGSTVEDLIQGNLITKTATNLFAIGASAANGIREFIDWYITEENIENNTETILYSNTGSYNTANKTVTFPVTINDISNQGNYLYTSTDLGAYYLLNNISLKYSSFRNNNTVSIYILSNTRDSFHYYLANDHTTGTVRAQVGNMNFSTTYNVYYQQLTNAGNISSINIPQFNSLGEMLEAFSYDINNPSQLKAVTGTIDIPSIVANEDNLYLDVGAPSVADVSGLADWVLGEVEANSLTATYDVDSAPPVPAVGDVNIESISTGAISSIQSAVQSAIQSAIQQSEAIQVNTDHHILGFTLPSFDLNLSGIWHYVHDAVGTASPFINFLKSLLTSVPWLAIPLYMSFTLIVVLGVFRRFLH